MRRLALVLLLACCWVPAWASTLERLSLDEMIAKSTAIVRGRVTGSSAAYHGPIIYTHYRVHVSETLKGTVGGSLDVMVPGGVAGAARQSFAGAPELDGVTEYVLFLWTGKSGTHIIGLTQGLFQIPAGASPKEYAVRQATAEVMLEPGTGRPVQDERLKIRLSDLKARIAAAAGRGAIQ